MKIAAAYIRVSTDDQMEYSPDSQLKEIQSYAKRNELVIPREFIFIEEEGRSGRKANKRPEFMRMIGEAKTKPTPFDLILVWKFSRFARNREDSIVYKSMLRKQCKIDVVSISENVGDDKMSILIEAMIEAMDEYYSINLAEEVKRGMTEKATRGEPLAYAPFGYIMENGHLIPDENASVLVKRIFTDFLNGQGCREIAVQLNQLGARTKFGNLFENRSVEYILRNPVYVGKIRWNPTGKTLRNYDNPNMIISNGSHIPLIDLEDWNAAQIRISELKKMYPPKSHNTAAFEFALRGLVKCSSCGATLSAAVHGTYTSIQCNSYAKGRCKTSHSIVISRITEMVLDAIQEDFKSGKFELHLLNTSEQYTTKEFAEARIKKEEVKLQRIRDAYEAGIDTLEEYRANKEKIVNRIQEIVAEAPIEETKLDYKQIFREGVQKIIPQLLSPDTTEITKNQLLRTFIQKIIFNRANNIIQIFYFI